MMIRRCSNFSGLDENYFRIAVRCHADNEMLIKAIGEVL
jgi:histidinol-phosphate/aromatic aminotransferase/cobyric acid decarboxylase-like protein